MKLVIFDIDGTLANTKKVEDQCFISAFNQTFGIDISKQKWEDFENVTDWGITEEIILRTFDRKPYKEEYELMISNFVGLLETEKKKNADQFCEVKGAKDFFYYLKEKTPYEIGIATGSWEESAKIKLRAIGIDWTGICFSNSNYHKSREKITKDVIHQLEHKLGEAATQVFYFGDGAWDYETCSNLGINFIGIDIENDGNLKKLGAKTVFRDFSNMQEIIEKLK